MFARGGRGGKLLTFIFHRVLSVPDPLFPYEQDGRQFEWMMRFVAKNFTVLRLEDAASRLAAGDLPPTAACITFDDGYGDNVEVALPILRRHDLVGTFFVI
jgi:peptidoglycan/xylan/chitin deacetylase (PgdA/CDA1 family)